MADSLNQYFAMGGYAGFVWPAYGISAIVMAALVYTVFHGLKVREKALQTLRDRSREPS